jgi:hypothetical protein
MYPPHKEVSEREIRTQQQWLDGEEDLLRVLRRAVLCRIRIASVLHVLAAAPCAV